MAENSLADDIKRLQDAFRPVFDRERAAWREHGLSALARLEAMGVVLGDIGGNCPVQGHGSVDGMRFYFRARGEHWEFRVAATDDAVYRDEVFAIEREYPGGAFAAGWMDRHEAVGFIADGVEAFRAFLSPAPFAMEAGRAS